MIYDFWGLLKQNTKWEGMKDMNNETKKNATFQLILKIIIAVASAIAGALGATACKML